MRLLVLFLGFFTLAALPVSATEAIRVSVSTSWTMPVARVDRETMTHGIVFDLYRELGRLLGRSVVHVVLPRKRIDPAALAGDIDVRCYVNPRWTDVAEQFKWSKPLFDISNVVIGRSGVARPTSVDDLPERARISTVLGYRYQGMDEQFSAGRLERDESSDEEKMLLKVTAGRTSYGLALDLAVDWYRKTTPGHNLAAWKLPVGRTEMHCAVPLQGRVAADQVFAALEQMRKSGRLEAILKSYR